MTAAWAALVIAAAAVWITHVVIPTADRRMREECGCGASIRGRRRDVRAWRLEHRHETGHPPMPPTSGGSQVEHAYQPAGFRPEDS